MDIDTSGKKINQRKITRSMRLGILSGALGIPFLIICAPGQILSLFVKNYLGASSMILGILFACINIAAVFNILSIYVFSGNRDKKTFWIITSLIQKSTAFIFAFVGFYVYNGGSKILGIALILITCILSESLRTMCGPGWWAWMTDLIPETKRAAFFGKRTSIMQLVQVLLFFAVTSLLDLYSSYAFLIFGTISLFGGIGGLLEVLLHTGIPEPDSKKNNPIFGKKVLLAPLKDKQFLRFSIIIGIYLMSIFIVSPFIAPYITEKDGIGAPNVWLGIMSAITMGIWVITAPLWGIIIDKMGKKPVVIIGGLGTFTWIGYLFMTQSNYFIVLPIVAAINGIISPGFWEGMAQLMLSLTKDKYRTSYIAWFWTIYGIFSALGSFVGGLMYNLLEANPITVGIYHMNPIHVMIVVSSIPILFSLNDLTRIQRVKEKSIGRVLSTIFNPGIFRAFTGMGILNKPLRSKKISKVLRGINKSAAGLMTPEIIMRLDDPDSEVRNDAATALGRLGSPEAEDALISRLSDTTSPVKVAAARALGVMGSQKAVPLLIEALSAVSEDLQEAAAASLGIIENPASEESLLNLLRSDSTESVKASGAIAISHKKVWTAADDIYTLMHSAGNWVLKRQMSIAMANLFGHPGEFYAYVTGDTSKSEDKTQELFKETERLLNEYRKYKDKKIMKKKDLNSLFKIMLEKLYDSDYEECAKDLLSTVEIVRELFKRDEPFFEFGNWLFTKIRETFENQKTQNFDILLGMYFIRISLLNAKTRKKDRK